jgi:hypothetical protein
MILNSQQLVEIADTIAGRVTMRALRFNLRLPNEKIENIFALLQQIEARIQNTD